MCENICVVIVIVLCYKFVFVGIMIVVIKVIICVVCFLVNYEFIRGECLIMIICLKISEIFFWFLFNIFFYKLEFMLKYGMKIYGWNCVREMKIFKEFDEI